MIKSTIHNLNKFLFFSFFLLLASCSNSNLPPLPVVENVNLNQFMGDWYVISVIPTFIETESYNAIENYKLNSDGTIKTTFTFNKGSLDGEKKEYNPKGFIVPGTNNAIWKMQFLWPFKSDFRISYLDENYLNTIIAREKRDYVWIMSRKPKLSDEELNKLEKIVASFGYDKTKLRRVPHNN